MRAEKFKVVNQSKVSTQIKSNFPYLSYNSIMKLFRNRDIKVNGKKISSDEIVNSGDEIIFYSNLDNIDFNIEIVYEDENILVVFKERNLEVVSSNENETLEKLLNTKYNKKVFAVHRLDRNTTGLVVFAKNEMSKLSLESSFKEKTLEKYYLAVVCFKPPKNEDKMIAYLNKDSKKSFVKISDFPQKYYEKIQTNYKVLKSNEEISLVEIRILTGKTHQIRAHFSHIGNPLLGDEKYGCSALNKKYKLRYQCLCAYKLIFHFEEKDFLSYLNNKELKVENSKIDFLKLI